MSDYYLPGIKSVVSRLKSVTPVTDLVSTRVYTDVPQNETFPYIVVRMDDVDFSTKTWSGMDFTLEVHCFSRTNSPKQAGDIRSAVYNALHRQESALALDSGGVTDIQYETGSTFIEDDGVTWHGLIQFRFIIS